VCDGESAQLSLEEALRHLGSEDREHEKLGVSCSKLTALQGLHKHVRGLSRGLASTRLRELSLVGVSLGADRDAPAIESKLQHAHELRLSDIGKESNSLLDKGPLLEIHEDTDELGHDTSGERLGAEENADGEEEEQTRVFRDVSARLGEGSELMELVKAVSGGESDKQRRQRIGEVDGFHGDRLSHF
jgi:hypothetical protein